MGFGYQCKKTAQIMNGFPTNNVGGIPFHFSEYLETFEPKWVKSETILIQWVYSDCIYDTILDLLGHRWYLGYKLNNPISFNC